MNERIKIQNKIKEIIERGNWYDLTHVCKEESTGYALYYLALFTIKQNQKIRHITNILTEE